ncbi:hypothetical protein CEXT_157621 [Caerostris extrusa]|uniref:Uncharacterized protein n=1 Tax=Caerostris extrusa TaxID=172846 RepID=A0AAV4W1M1_CAEEX|nr:hypothetical protein CEXT_157621 [Caerostris extrusa]
MLTIEVFETIASRIQNHQPESNPIIHRLDSGPKGGLVNGLPSSYSDGSTQEFDGILPWRDISEAPCSDYLVKILAWFELLGHSLENLDHMGLICVCGRESIHKA